MKKLFLFFIINLLGVSLAHATHIRAGEITAKRVSCTGNTYEFTLTAYRDTGSSILFGGGTFYFGDGQYTQLEPNQTYSSAHPLGVYLKKMVGEEVEMVQFKIRHTYGGPNTYKVAYTEDFRNVGIANISNSGSVPFYIETVIRIDPFFGCNNSPVFLIPPVDKAAVGKLFYHNPGAYDPDGDSLAFKLIKPQSAEGVIAPGYEFPNISAGGQNQDQTGPATFTLNPTNGDLIWDAPALEGEFNTAFVVEEWRKIDGKWYQLGSVIRDMQIIVKETDNNPPELQIPNDTCVEAGTLLKGTVIAKDPDAASTKLTIEGFGGPFEFTPPATLTPGVDYPNNPDTAYFEWQTSCNHIREDPYLIRFKATDNGPGIRLTDYKTWSVRIVPPAPQNLVTQLKPGRAIQLQWDQYDCGDADVIQIYRKVDSFAFTPDNCEVGIPPGSGYELIGSVPANVSSYLDDNNGAGLAFGARYCYRLVAVYAPPKGGESYASNEACAKISATAPVIINADVKQTDTQNGEVFVRWMKPFEIDTTLYPPPYRYRVMRGVGQSGGTMTAVATLDSDTTFTDIGLNTEEKAYHYQIELYSVSDDPATTDPIEVSASASTVWLTAYSGVKTINLNWNANTPWSNTIQNYPYHYIYRDRVLSSDPSKLVLIDSVNVTLDGYQYQDEGQFNGKDLNEKLQYCYYVVTSGGYGNDTIPEPLVNASQILCAQPNDTVAPCPPSDVSFSIQSDEDCLNFLSDKPCDFNNFQNTIRWNSLATDSCDAQVNSYNVYFSPDGTEDGFDLIANVTDTFFVHTGLSSFAGCYKVAAVDRSGNISQMSNAICKDNCPNIAFPNVFTPNGDGKNDTFSPYYPGAAAGDDFDTRKCPRFVQSIDFHVYNRYGKEVYTYKSGTENSVYINWNGRNNVGKMLSSGVYYYEADVTFDVLNPNGLKKTFKGIVHILY